MTIFPLRSDGRIKKRFFPLVLLFLAFLFGNAPLFSQETADAALAPPTVYREIPERYADEARQFQGIASLEVTSNDRVWACWYTCGGGEDDFNIVMLVTSGDRGRTWEKVFAIDPDGDGPVRAYDATPWLDPDGALWIFWTQSKHYFDGRKGVWAMKTENPEAGKDAEWSAPKRLCHGLMMNKPLVTSDGRWLYPVSVWQVEREHAEYEMADLQGANVFLSTDRGRSVSFLGQTKVPLKDALYDEHIVIEKADKSLRMFLRTNYGIAESTSRDGGATWSEVAPSALKNTSSRFFIRRLRSGALLLVKNGPLDEDVGRTRLTAFVSDDDGDTWLGGLELDTRGEISYPDGGQAPDGTIYVVYDRNRFSDREILMARFTEDDVRQGRLVSATGKFQILVNQATGKMREN